ncbi:MAG: cupin domain-containing protein [Tenuifilaceae bacterium]
MITNTLETAEQVPFKLNGRKMYIGEKTEIVHLTLNPGEEIALHANPFDVFFFFIEGSGIVYFEETTNKVEANTTVFIEKEKQRGMKNSGTGILRVLVVKIF